MKSRYFLIISALVLLAISCLQGSSVFTRLNSAELLLKEYPDSARHMIERIDKAEIRPYRARARYALLNTMAIDRCGVDTADYHLIVPADEYYLRHGSVESRTKMHFYKGRLLYNGGDYDSAMKEFMIALNLSDRIKDNWLNGMICSWISAVYSTSGNASEELHYHSMAYDYFVANGDLKYIDNARYLLANSYHNNNCLSISDSLFSLIGTDSRFYSSALLGLAGNEMFKQDFNASRAVDLFKKAQEYGAPFSIDQYYQYAYALLQNGQKAQCESLLAKLQSFPDDVKVVWWKYHIAKASGDTERALSLLERYREESGEFVLLKQSQSAYKSVSEYYSDASVQSEEKATRIKLLSIIAFLVLVSGVLVFIILKQRQLLLIKGERDNLERNNDELRRALNELESLDGAGGVNKAHAKQLWESYITMYRQRNASIGRFYGKDISKSVLPHHIEGMVEEILDEISGTEASPNAFEQRLNKDLDNVMIKYRQDFPHQTSNQYKFVSLVFAGFKDPTIGAILDVSTSAISSRKNRLKKQILETKSPNREIFEVFLKNPKTV